MIGGEGGGSDWGLSRRPQRTSSKTLNNLTLSKRINTEEETYSTHHHLLTRSKRIITEGRDFPPSFPFLLPQVAVFLDLGGTDRYIRRMRGGGVTEHPIGVEELLVSDIPRETVPVLLSPDAATGVVAFASEIF